MSSTEVYESLLVEIASMSRGELIEQLTHFSGDLPLDFSEDYLNGCQTDRLRHLLTAALWRCRTKGQRA
jgi:hypothetical protein